MTTHQAGPPLGLRHRFLAAVIRGAYFGHVPVSGTSGEPHRQPGPVRG